MNRKEPLFRVVKRESSSPVRQALAYVAAVVIALLIGAALLSSMDVDPLTFYQKMVTMGIPGNKFPWRIVENFVKLFVPLLITSLALSLAFRMRFWNIGGEGSSSWAPSVPPRPPTSWARSCPSPWWCWSWPCAASWAAACTA